jgi:hypothetical protein
MISRFGIISEILRSQSLIRNEGLSHKSSIIMMKPAKASKCSHEKLWFPMKKIQPLAIKEAKDDGQFFSAVTSQTSINQNFLLF